MSTCQNNPEKSSTTKINELTLSVYSLLTHCAFDATKNKIDFYFYIYSLWVKDCMKKFCKDIKEHATKVINYERKRNDTISKWRK